MNNKSKKNIIVIAIILTICVVLGISFKMYSTIKEQEYVDSQIEIINHNLQTFKNEENRTEKLEILKTQIEKLEEIEKSEGYESELTLGYKSRVHLMKDYFVSDYETKISKNTIENISKSTDKDLIETSKNNLKELVNLIESEKDFTLTNPEAENYKNTINSLIKSYEERLNEIKTVDKKETQKTTNKANQEKTTVKANNETSSNTNTETNTPPSSGPYTYPYPDWFKRICAYDLQTGEEIPGTEQWLDPTTNIIYSKDGSSYLFN